MSNLKNKVQVSSEEDFLRSIRESLVLECKNKGKTNLVDQYVQAITWAAPGRKKIENFEIKLNMLLGEEFFLNENFIKDLFNCRYLGNQNLEAHFITAFDKFIKDNYREHKTIEKQEVEYHLRNPLLQDILASAIEGYEILQTIKYYLKTECRNPIARQTLYHDYKYLEPKALEKYKLLLNKGEQILLQELQWQAYTTSEQLRSTPQSLVQPIAYKYLRNEFEEILHYIKTNLLSAQNFDTVIEHNVNLIALCEHHGVDKSEVFLEHYYKTKNLHSSHSSGANLFNNPHIALDKQRVVEMATIPLSFYEKLHLKIFLTSLANSEILELIEDLSKTDSHNYAIIKSLMQTLHINKVLEQPLQKKKLLDIVSDSNNLFLSLEINSLFKGSSLEEYKELLKHYPSLFRVLEQGTRKDICASLKPKSLGDVQLVKTLYLENPINCTYFSHKKWLTNECLNCLFVSFYCNARKPGVQVDKIFELINIHKPNYYSENAKNVLSSIDSHLSERSKQTNCPTSPHEGRAIIEQYFGDSICNDLEIYRQYLDVCQKDKLASSLVCHQLLKNIDLAITYCQDYPEQNLRSLYEPYLINSHKFSMFIINSVLAENPKAQAMSQILPYLPQKIKNFIIKAELQNSKIEQFLIYLEKFKLNSHLNASAQLVELNFKGRQLINTEMPKKNSFNKSRTNKV